MKKILYLFTLVFTFYSCSNIDEHQPGPAPIPESEYTNGIFILNEGNFQTPNASVSFLSEDFSVFYENIFASSNSGENLGDVAQSMYIYGNQIFIVVNNSNIVRVLDRYTFKETAQITENLALPRYLTVSNGNIYVTNASSKAITIYDAQTLEYKDKITLDFAPEQIVSTDQNLFVQTDPYTAFGKAFIISIQTRSVIKTINTNGYGGGIKKYKDFVYALFSNSSFTYIYEINDEGESYYNIITQGNTKNLSIDKNYIYFTNEHSIYKVNLSTQIFDDEQLFYVGANGYSTFYGFNVIDDKIYISDAKGFTQKSVVKIYDLNGNLLKEQTTGIGTNGFYKN